MRFDNEDGRCHSTKQLHISSSPSYEQLSSSLLPKFQTAYADIEGKRRKRRILTFDIEKIDSCCINLTIEDCVCIIGKREYTNTILIRLCVRALMSKRQGGFESANVIFIDAGGKHSDVYQCVNFARQYGLDIKKILQSIRVTRAFTIYQLANLLIKELPRVIRRFNVKVIMIADLLNLFTNDPNIDHNEAVSLIKEIINSIRKTLDNILVIVSFQQQHNDRHHHKLYGYHKILLPRFDKRIEITNNNTKINLLDLKVYNNNYSKKNCNRSLLLEETDLQIVSAYT
ncbi:MAG: hypothetical protein M3250_09985 [Thermoproteota archaeon]|nr:hypothetical protein [Thermoproteota archaeon]